jgi:hypothetical protein
MQCFCQSPCSTTNDGLLVCNYYTSNIGGTVCLFTLHNVNIPHFDDSTIPVACQCARCLATLSIAKRISYDNGVLVPFDHVHCHACGNFCMLKQSNRQNANQSRFYIVCASARINPTVQLNRMQRPLACQTFFAWADFLRTTPNRLIAQHINRLPVPKRKNDDDDDDENDEVKMARSEQIPSSNNAHGDAS